MHVRGLLFLFSKPSVRCSSRHQSVGGAARRWRSAVTAVSRRRFWPTVGLLLAISLLPACESTTPACTPALDANACIAAPQCSGNLRDCKNGGLDGCETDITADVNNCGGCGNKCPAPQNGAPGQAVCDDGVCSTAVCGTRYKDCNGDPGDGCETDTYRNVDNCGACGTKCPGGANAAAACGLGQCKLACQAGYLNCDGKTDNGCETNGAADLNNCGTCGNKCLPSGAANATCASGSCAVSSCTVPFLTCQAGPTTRCETNISNDANNCGGCGIVCDPVANGTRACISNNCGIGSCNATYDDCDGLIENGCEAVIVSNPLHCGSCTPCPGFAFDGITTYVGCNINACTFSCRGDNYDVNNNASDGCEVPDNDAGLHTPGSATGKRGTKSCVDGDSVDVLTGKILSDSRNHFLPPVVGFVPSVGASPDYWEVVGGGGVCINDIAFSFTTTGGGNTACYQFLVESDRYSGSVILTGAQTGSLAYGDVINPAYGNGATIQITVQKICSLPTQEAVDYVISYHL